MVIRLLHVHRDCLWLLLITGASVRADTTLIGFDQNDWQRGNRSYVFRGGGTLMACVKKLLLLNVIIFTSNSALRDKLGKLKGLVKSPRQQGYKKNCC